MLSMVLRSAWKPLLLVLTVLTALGVPLWFLYEVSVQQNVLLELLLMGDAFGLALLYGVMMVWAIEAIVSRPQQALNRPRLSPFNQRERAAFGRLPEAPE